MLNISTSPAIPFDCLQLMRLVHEVEMKLLGDRKGIWHFIKQSMKHEPARVTIDTIKDMATDNYNAVADVLGVLLTDKILKV